MEADYIRNFIKKHNLTHYEVSQLSGLSINGIAYFMNSDSNPRRKTLKKLEDFVEKFTNEELESNVVKNVSEPETLYQNVSNEDIYKLIESLGISLGTNAKLVSNLLTDTFQNTKKILKDTNEIRWYIMDEANKKLQKEKK